MHLGLLPLTSPASTWTLRRMEAPRLGELSFLLLLLPSVEEEGPVTRSWHQNHHPCYSNPDHHSLDAVEEIWSHGSDHDSLGLAVDLLKIDKGNILCTVVYRFSV